MDSVEKFRMRLIEELGRLKTDGGDESQVGLTSSLFEGTDVSATSGEEAAILVHDLEGRIIDANCAFRRMLGYEHKHLASLCLVDIVESFDEDGFRSRVARYEAGWPVHALCRFRRKSGAVIEAETTCCPRRMDGGVAVVCFVENLTKRLAAERELGRYRRRFEDAVKERTRQLADANDTLQQQFLNLTRSEKRLADERDLLRTLIDNLPDHIFVKDSLGRYVIDNRAHALFLGAKRAEEVIGKTAGDFFPKELADKYYADDMAIIRSGHPQVNLEEPTLNRIGKERWISTTKIPLRDDEGRIRRLVCISRDVTELKEAQDALRKAKDELEVRVAERTVDLRLANERLEIRIDQLNFLTRTSLELSQYIRENELLHAILRAFTARFPHCEAVVCRRSSHGFVCACETPGLHDDRYRAAAEGALKPVFEERMRQPFMLRDWRESERLAALDWTGLEHFPCYIMIPLRTDNSTIACVQIFTDTEFHRTFSRELPLFTTLSTHAAVCLSNAIYYREAGERARMQGELDAARNIQQSFTPRYRPSIAHVDLKSVYYPAFEVGGDYLDYFQTDNGDWVVVIADVCGKGVPAALLMTVLRSTFRVEARDKTSARDLLCAVNNSMLINLDSRSFVTALCLLIRKDGMGMTYSRAGHPQLIKISAGKTPEKIECNGIALGLVPDRGTFDAILDEVDVPLSAGDRFLI
ncbi:MAG: PAS domain S-box protein, partial [Chitinivibrionales bacterium]|nr:PAS domain S-box protein [Chitinivibrionales bacterium]MBD3355725.1 PAS domain S-box protein [Chitinivibrionales bacterium]